ncbi:SMC family ATPase [Natronosporangium hydrolyticum]|uniref:Nuclease SbcCD subunit C n=1 Tax=Natronosporangium hydrolyticum TaxID=2811111 RepID=A0A895YMC4_9ACTN|nr:SMC family ATPase [Natronosporangium hydrolyticum]QSB16463.1 SMC family ATPase [Natronosporangium hydrolyticum]
MRPLRLDLAGFAVFRDETSVDFTDADFFALVGPTGAGKSTLLDAICFALYGTVPRWRDPRSVANALAPSATEARVRLVFETAGARYVATRVVRRDGKGRVKTAAAGLQRMPDGFDVRRLDTGLTPDDLGEVLAGTPTELDQAVPEVLGLPYDQFVTCVILPQGEFAEFLHAKPATRQQILVNLLGLHVYERVREQATTRATRAEAELAATDRLLDDLGVVEESELTAAQQRVADAEQLTARVAEVLPRLAAARDEQARAEDELQLRQRQIRQLGQVRPPAEATVLAAAATTARQARSQASEVVTAAEEQEEKLRSELAAAGDPATLRALLGQHQEHEQLTGQRDELRGQATQAEREFEAATEALTTAQAEARQADAELEAARAEYTRAQTADQATALRAQLHAGDPCPVCTQPVAEVPPLAEDSAVARAEAAGKQARAAADRAERRLAERDVAVRDLDRASTAARTRAESLDAQVAELAATLADAPPVATLRADLAAIAATEQRVQEAATAVRQAREAYRRAVTEAEQADAQLSTAWRSFESTRDSLAPLGPPPADREDLQTAWRTLAAWASGRSDELAAGEPAATAAVADAEAAVAKLRAELTEAFTGAGLPTPALGADAAAASGAASVAAERARAELDRLQQRRDQAQRLLEQRADHVRAAQVARALAQHLRANNFEAWLLAEALDRLVAGASAILRELSGGQYDLVHQGRDFFVIDHHDAGLRRPVRTLSGGETFQASLALALALSEQLAGVSTASASLESIVLDEGFGTLDAATLDAVAATLENLAARGDRVVGVVTHVPALAERIPVRYEVSKDVRSARVTRVGL